MNLSPGSHEHLWASLDRATKEERRSSKLFRQSSAWTWVWAYLCRNVAKERSKKACAIFYVFDGDDIKKDHNVFQPIVYIPGTIRIYNAVRCISACPKKKAKTNIKQVSDFSFNDFFFCKTVQVNWKWNGIYSNLELFVAPLKRRGVIRSLSYLEMDVTDLSTTSLIVLKCTFSDFILVLINVWFAWKFTPRNKRHP